MKTPRQLLLERYQADEDRLNAVSESVVEQLPEIQRCAGTSHVQTPGFLLRLAHPFGSWSGKAAWNWYWRSLAAAWVIILALHLASLGFSDSAAREETVARARELTPETRKLLEQQWAWRQELISPVEFAGQSDPPESSVPGPRSALPRWSRMHHLHA